MFCTGPTLITLMLHFSMQPITEHLFSKIDPFLEKERFALASKSVQKLGRLAQDQVGIPREKQTRIYVKWDDKKTRTRASTDCYGTFINLASDWNLQNSTQRQFILLHEAVHWKNNIKDLAVIIFTANILTQFAHSQTDNDPLIPERVQSPMPSFSYFDHYAQLLGNEKWLHDLTAKYKISYKNLSNINCTRYVIFKEYEQYNNTTIEKHADLTALPLIGCSDCIKDDILSDYINKPDDTPDPEEGYASIPEIERIVDMLKDKKCAKHAHSNTND